MESGDSSKTPMFNSMVAYAGSRYFRQVSGVLLAVLRPKLLGPTFYGLWTLFKVIPRYSRFIPLGAREALRFYLPYHRERSEGDRVQTITNTVFVATGFLHIVVAVVLLMVCLLWGFTKEAKFGLLCMALYLPLEFYVRHVISILRSEEKFGLIARYNYFESILIFVLTIPLLYWLRIYGVFIAVLGTRLILAIQMFRHGGLRARPSFNLKTYVEMVRKGFPIMMSDFCVDLIMTSDRIIIAVLLGQTSLGYYGIAIMLLAILIQLPGTAREIMEPQVMRDMDEHASESFVNEYLLKPLVNTAYLMPFMIGPVCLMLPAVLPLVLPKFLPGIVPTQVIALGVYFLALSFVPRPLIVANGWQSQVARYLPIVLVVNVGVSAALIKMGYGILGAALGSAFSFALLFFTLLIFVALKLTVRGDNWWRHIFALVLPFPVMCIVLFALSGTIPNLIANDFVSASVQSVVFICLMAGFHLVSSHRFDLLKNLALWR